MQKAFEKIVEMLEEKKKEYLESFRTHGDNERYGIACGFGDSIKIVNQVAEEYKQEVCEWWLCDEEANVYDTTCRNSHILLEGSPIDNNYEYCPYCGKKIKVIQPKGE